MRFLFLAYYHPRYIDPLKKWGDRLRDNGHDVAEMYPDKYYREEVIRELYGEYDVVLYFGHGTPHSWSGYRKITENDLMSADSERPGKTILSLSCYATSSAARGKRTFCRTLLNRTLSGCLLGYSGRIRYEENLGLLNRLFHAFQKSSEKRDFTIFLKRFFVAEKISPSLPLQMVRRYPF